ncbi:caspase, EACC1-associated type [Allocoleopsis franciscana]|uniref:Peptidase C14 caspase domain-containing protein n=1 Tax=Allocoleopsis franciscana PCC 7113 TaxID=1173027 RepID=K9WB48_9CYAN|nr:caspase family protein [Allocoleopsis franciscana]AFZ16742.1 hypothetical protein Mic7113_0835 [Allocoleopsis franciscana PCC 7113]
MAKVALLIGVSEYEQGLNSLLAAAKDIEAMRDVLLDPGIGGFTKPNITVLKNPERQTMEEAIYSLFAGRHKDDLLLLFFSGHGIKDDLGNLYLATRRTRKSSNGELISPTAVAARFVHDCMSRSRSKRQIVILDCCFSGAFAEGLSAKDDGTINIREQLGGEGRAVLTSSSSTQYSFEQEGEELSLYTRFLIEGMKTGEADQDGDDVISIDELHEYASRKVKEVKPEVKPEIYAIREGFKIRLTKVPLGDPRQRYQKEVARYGKRGDLTIVSRGILDALRAKLEFSVDEAKVLEDEILEPYRKEFRQKIQRYEQIFTDLLQQEESVSDATRQELQNLQQVLELRNEDTVPIEAKVTAYIQAQKQNLRVYEQSLREALRQEYPLGEVKRSELRRLQLQLELSDADISRIEARLGSEVKEYYKKLRQYKQAFAEAVRHEFPLNEPKRNELKIHQQNLELSDIDVTSVEAQITAEIESYHQKLQQYEQAFIKATQYKQYPSESTRQQLKQTWQILGLNQVDVATIETKITTQIETYQKNLRQYEQEFASAAEQQYPLNSAKRQELRQQQQALNLTAEDIEPVETQIITQIEDHWKKLRQYEQVLISSIQYEYPFTDATREELRQFQKVLELGDGDVARIEKQVIANNNKKLQSGTDSTSDVDSSNQKSTSSVAKTNKKSPQENTSQTSQKDEIYQQKLKKYEQEVASKVNLGLINDDYIRGQLKELQRRLEIKDSDAAAIESRATGSVVETDKSTSIKDIAPRTSASSASKQTVATQSHPDSLIPKRTSTVSVSQNDLSNKFNSNRTLMLLFFVVSSFAIMSGLNPFLDKLSPLANHPSNLQNSKP